MADLKKIKELRDRTGASIALCNKALLEGEGSIEKAGELLKKWGIELADKKAGNETSQGILASYVHHNKKVAALVTLRCQTDFVAKNTDFQKLGQEIAMQVASMAPKTTEELLKQAYIRDGKITIQDLIKEQITRLGENITLGEFVRYTI